MQFDSLEAILDFAMEKEIEAADFYRTVSREERYADTSRMFQEFAAEEEKHQKMLEDFKAKGISKSLEDYQLRWIRDIKRSNFVVEQEYHPGMPYQDILMLAIKREEKALALYNDFLKQVEHPDSKKLFQVLCQEEAKHKRGLENLYDDYMAQLGD